MIYSQLLSTADSATTLVDPADRLRSRELHRHSTNRAPYALRIIDILEIDILAEANNE